MAEDIKLKLVVKNKKGTHQMSLDEIVYLEKDGRRIIVHAKEQDVVFYGRFRDIMHYLDERFLHCHESYVFNMDEIVLMTARGVYMVGNYSVYLGRDTYRRGKRIFNAYLDKKFQRKR